MRVLHGRVAELAGRELRAEPRTSQDNLLRPGGGQVEVQVVAVHSPDLGGLHLNVVHGRLKGASA